MALACLIWLQIYIQHNRVWVYMYINTHTDEITSTYVYSDCSSVPARAAGVYTT